jgi:nitrite reductase/ring-hydroxylating ferredoxin subunit
LHAWKVNLVTGGVERPGAVDACVETYPTRVDQGTIVVGLPAETVARGSDEAA